MKSLSRSLILALTIAASGTLATSAEAGCHGRFGGRVYSSHVRVYSPPRVVYAQPQPVYVQPTFPAEPVFSQPRPPATTPLVTQPATPPQYQNPFSAPATPVQPNSAQLNSVQPGGAEFPGTAGPASAEQTALQALGGFAPPAPQPATVPTTSAPTAQPGQPAPQDTGLSGVWTASLGNGASVRLTMTADGSFEWIASNASGSQSSFQGRFAASAEQLSLVRSGDSQQLSGTLTRTGADTFSFQLSTSNAAKLDFRRS